MVWCELQELSYSIHFNGSGAGQQHKEQPFPLCFQIFSMIPLNIHTISNLVFMWQLWCTCTIQDTKFMSQFLVADLGSWQLSHKSLANLKSHSWGGRQWGQVLGSRVLASQTGSQRELDWNDRGFFFLALNNAMGRSTTYSAPVLMTIWLRSASESNSSYLPGWTLGKVWTLKFPNCPQKLPDLLYKQRLAHYLSKWF